MKIAFDAKRAAQNRTGLGNYSRFVLDILSQHTEGNELVLFAPNPRKAQLIEKYGRQEGCSLRFPATPLARALRSLWRVWGIRKDIESARPDIFHGLSNELPLNIRQARGVKSVVTIHDLIFIHCPQYYKPIDRTIYNYKFRKACENADLVIAVSEYTKREIMHFYGTPEEKIRVVYQGCDKAFSQMVSEEKKQEVRERYALPEKFILYVGSIEERKNLMLLAKALRLMPEEVKVVAVGKHTPYADRVKEYLRENALEHRLSMLHGVPFSDLPALYQSAEVFVYPSRIEGFGIPLLEAISGGTPAIGCTGSCLEEAGGEGSLYVDPDDDKALAEAVLSVWNNPEKRAEMVEKGYAHAKKFSEEHLCRDLMDVYKELTDE